MIMEELNKSSKKESLRKSQSSSKQMQGDKASRTSLDEYCDANPWSGYCRIYDT